MHFSQVFKLPILSSLRTFKNVIFKLLQLLYNLLLRSVQQICHTPYLERPQKIHNFTLDQNKSSQQKIVPIGQHSNTCKVPPPPEDSPSSDTLATVHGSEAFQWKSTTLSLEPKYYCIKFIIISNSKVQINSQVSSSSSNGNHMSD